MTRIAFTKEDASCYADGAYGHKHIRTRLLDYVLWCSRVAKEQTHVKKIAQALSVDMSDDAWEELEAIDYLNTFCDDTCYFVLDSGDLLLVDAKEWSQS